jgi:hypothetical protein
MPKTNPASAAVENFNGHFCEPLDPEDNALLIDYIRAEFAPLLEAADEIESCLDSMMMHWPLEYFARSRAALAAYRQLRPEEDADAD